MQTWQDHESGTLRNAGPSFNGTGSGSGATMSDDDEKTRNLRDKVFRLKMRVKVLQERNKELRQWITKLTNRNHPARKSKGS
jgi:predicted RNase H-like nuclease (RuvC/YqgF family)